jgi:hypothetical protein
MKNTIIIPTLIMVVLVFFTSCASIYDVSDLHDKTDIASSYTNIDAVIGLIGDGNGGSKVVAYNTDTWDYATIRNLQDVSPDNYVALSANGEFLAYTTWDEDFVRRYLVCLNIRSGKKESYFLDFPYKNEIIKISWLPDCKTLLYVHRDAQIQSYQQIETLDISTGIVSVLVKGEVWHQAEAVNIGEKSDDFYLKGAGRFLKTKEIEAIPDTNEQWNIYLTADDFRNIFNEYGGNFEFGFDTPWNFMYVNFSAPKCSPDGKKITYSATLQRSSAPGFMAPLWVCSSVWIYDIDSKTNNILYAQSDNGAIGRVDWIDDSEVCFVSYYDISGGQNNINILDIDTGIAEILFPYTEDNYNNVTLLPLSKRKLTFSSSAKSAIYENSDTYVLDIDTGECIVNNIFFENNKILLEEFIYTPLQNNLTDIAANYSE